MIHKLISSFVFSGIVFGASMGAQGAQAYNQSYVGDVVEYEAEYEDTFVHLAREYNLGFVEVRAANPRIDPWLPGDGTDMVLPTRHIFPDAPREGIVINLPEMRLYAFVNGDRAPDTHPIGIGREGLSTPLGETKIVRKMAGPTWRPTARMRREDPTLPPAVEPGPENPMGTHALYLGWPQYAIHGTNKPYGIGRRISSGCIRMYPEGIVSLFYKAPVGTKVRVVDQPIKLGWVEDELYLEAHPDIEQSIEMEEKGQITTVKLTNKDMDRIIKVAGDYKDKLDWTEIRNAVHERSGVPVVIAKRSGKWGKMSEKTDDKNRDAFMADLEAEETARRMLNQEVNNTLDEKKPYESTGEKEVDTRIRPITVYSYNH